MQTIIKPAICPVWGKIWVTPYGACPDLSGRSAVRGKRSPRAINPGGVVYTINRTHVKLYPKQGMNIPFGRYCNRSVNLRILQHH
jgi:hypothetical protein